MADASTLSYKPQVLVDTADLPEKDWLELLPLCSLALGDMYWLFCFL